jgi:DNA integrity scanning protein DisA with diadenylate cyclase activity
MRKSIFTIAILALSFLNVNATEVTTASNNLEIVTSISRENIIEVFDWSVKTATGNYSGTSNTIEEAQKMIQLVSTGEIILDRKIETFFQLKNEASNNDLRLFFWEVETTNGIKPKK